MKQLDIQNIKQGQPFIEHTPAGKPIKFQALADAHHVESEKRTGWEVKACVLEGPEPPFADDEGNVVFFTSDVAPHYGPSLYAAEPERFDSRGETLHHIARVRDLLLVSRTNLLKRGEVHDASKLLEPEKSGFDSCTARLRTLEYGSEEYKAALEERPTLDHHYRHNSHHPEFYAAQYNHAGGTPEFVGISPEIVKCGDAIARMSLFDLVEMLMDWKAATERMKGGGDIRRSLELNMKRFGIGTQLAEILNATVKEMGW